VYDTSVRVCAMTTKIYSKSMRTKKKVYSRCESISTPCPNVPSCPISRIPLTRRYASKTQRHPKPKKPHLHNNQTLHIRLLTPLVKAHDSRDGDSAPQQRDSDFSSAWGALVTFLPLVR
jgi:hypothetical protein